MAKSPSGAPEAPENRRGRTLVTLRGMVLRGEVPPLARIEEVELARTLGVSQPLIRRALEQLEQEGLVESTGGTFRVRRLTMSDIGDAIAARGALEGVAASLAATRLSDVSELERARKIQREIEQITALFSSNQPPDPEQMARYGSLNAGFHNELVDLAKSPLLRWFADRIYAVAFASPTAVVAPPDGGGAATASAQHTAILEALASGDASRAESIVREHALLAFRSLENAVDCKAQAGGHVGLALIRGSSTKAKKPALPAPVAKPRRSRPTDVSEGAAERVLDAAASLFSAKGYHATTTRELAALLEMQQASLYHYMASKEDLLYRICRAVMVAVLQDVPSALASVPEQPPKLGVFIQTHLRAMIAHYERTISMVTEFRALSPPHRTEITAMESSYSEILRGEIEAAQRSRILRKDIPEKYLRWALFNYLNWTPRWFHKTGPLKLEELAGIYEAVFFDGVATGERAAAGAFRLDAGAHSAGIKSSKPNRETLARLIAGAAELFSKHGYEATSTRSVATSLGLEKATLYYHVRSKEDLLYAICKSSIERLEADVEGALAGLTDPVDRLQTLIVTQCSSLLHHQTEHATALAEVRALSPERLGQIVTLRKRHQARVRQAIEAGQKAGALRGDTPARFLGLMLEGLMDRTVVWYRRGKGCSPSELGSYFAEIFLHGARFAPNR